MEQARKALHEALTRNGNLTWSSTGSYKLEELTLEGLNVGKGTTLTVKKTPIQRNQLRRRRNRHVRHCVQSEKRLTVHDKEGKLLFDGEIETEEQQQKVPAELWSKAKAMLDEMGPAKGSDSDPEARSALNQNPETKSTRNGWAIQKAMSRWTP